MDTDNSVVTARGKEVGGWVEVGKRVGTSAIVSTKKNKIRF